ncbi:Feline leukemia virus subgroup C receptor-related protein 1 [Hypsibius exemplaris]|uniref:Feline leukemia virus subgroup C receptor-related protein 1 n=1 Tax=Hypsibius exemplaris TaxID=2072580 RepID=A0A1W0XEZ5_HYPEX|nr:Feline leukemia virus subgroup C receptor-related protein 1 [Hypsibius exemplaris]
MIVPGEKSTRRMTECQVTPRRWAILAVFSLYSMSNQIQWISYSTINDKVTAFYSVSTTTVDWLSMVFMVAYIPLIFPATWLLDKRGLRLTGYIGAFLNFLGAVIKCFSPYSKRFVVTFVGQTVCGIAQVFILGLPARVAAVWFAEREVPFATAIGVFGTQLGVALGFLVPLIVPSIFATDSAEAFNLTIDSNRDIYSHNFAVLYYVKTGITGTLFLLVLFVFRDRPEHPPSPAQEAILQQVAHTSHKEWILILLKDRQFDALALVFGIIIGSFYAVGTLLTQLILYYFEGETANAGYIGVTLVLAGLVASVAFGLFLSWTGRFRETTIFVYGSSFAAMVIFMVVLHFSDGKIGLAFMVATLLGFFMTGYMPVGYELAAEITYPAPEGTTSGLLNCSAQIFGVILTLSMGEIVAWHGPLAANGLIVAFLSVGTIITCCIKTNLKRTAICSKPATTPPVLPFTPPPIII